MSGVTDGRFSSLVPLLQRVSTWLEDRGLKLAVAESCTGGLIAAACTSMPGSSVWFEAGFVTYSIPAKIRMLDVPADLISRFGVVSGPVAEAMATGALHRCAADIAVSVTGIAGPADSAAEPAGSVWLAWAVRRPASCRAEHFVFAGDRDAVRFQAVQAALERIPGLAAGPAG